MPRYFISIAVTLGVTAALISGCATVENTGMSYNPAADSLRFEGEVHLRNIRQLTFGGNNAEAYWSFDNSKLIFQSDWRDINSQGCDQIFTMPVSDDATNGDSRYTLVSTGKGRTTCSYFMPDGRVLYSSTHAADHACPPPPSREHGRYVWAIYPSYDIYVADADGSNPEVLIGGPGYDAEATVSPDGRYILYTSTRSGDLELWRYEIATGANLQLTSDLGYDGGAFFSKDGKKIVWRASRPTGDAAARYSELLSQNLVEPAALNVFVANSDGSDPVQVTDLPGANWAPYFHPDGQRVLFCSNFESPPGGRPVFAIYMINLDGSGLKKLTFSNTFDAFPMFSHDGTRIAFASNRNVSRTPTRDTNVFVADWVESPEAADLNFKDWKAVTNK